MPRKSKPNMKPAPDNPIPSTAPAEAAPGVEGLKKAIDQGCRRFWSKPGRTPPPGMERMNYGGDT